MEDAPAATDEVLLDDDALQLEPEGDGASLQVPLIPRDELFGNPDKAAARISPDGARLSYLRPSTACSTSGSGRSAIRRPPRW